MKLIILGSGTCIPHFKRNSPGYYLEIGNDNVLIDPGSGTLHRLGIAGIKVQDISKIFFSHEHVDHTADLIPFLFAKKNLLNVQNQKDIYLYGFKGLKTYFEELLHIYRPWIVTPDYKIKAEEPESELINFQNWSLEIKTVQHTENSTGFRFTENNRILTYSGDSDYCSNLVTLARNAGIALFECSFPDSYNVPDHLTPRKAATIASEAHVKKLVLTHLYPVCDVDDVIEECKKYYSGFVEIADDLNQYTL